jgi:hypothetical protein
VDVEVTKRFPDGLTLLNGLDQFRDGSAIIQEKSKVLILLYPFDRPRRDFRRLMVVSSRLP